MGHVPWHPEEMDEMNKEEIHGIDSVEMISVGIDIGTTTTHLLFSRLLARRSGTEYSTKFEVVEREKVFESDIILTPYEDETTIDTDAIDNFLSEMYDSAGYTSADIDTGAVIVTGEASRKKNAKAIASLFSEQAGKFVCATAGPKLESLMSAHGSGAIDLSVEEDVDVLHVDIGGGTTKIAYIVNGFVSDTASINAGAHLIEFDDNQKITRLEDAGRKVAADVGVDISKGDHITPTERERIADRYAELVLELIDGELTELAENLMVTEMPDREPFDVITFAGGVSEYIYDRDSSYYNDLGPELGQSIQKGVDQKGFRVAPLSGGIRATVIGSTQHSVQVSGNTITISNHDDLPLRNVPIVPFVVDKSEISTVQSNGGRGHHSHDHGGSDLTDKIINKLDLYDVDELEGGFAFGFHLHGTPSYDLLSTIADSVIAGWEKCDGENPIVLAFDSDVAMNGGRLVQERVDAPVIAIDGIELDQFGYIDIGNTLEATNAVPVTVKSLLFKG